MPTPSEILVSFAQGEPSIRCESVAEMDATLDRLHAEALDRQATDENSCPLQVSISFTGYEMYTGLGSAESFVMLGNEPYDEWYVAVGDAKAEGDEKVFYGDAQDTYWAPRNLIPIAVARDAVRYFVEHQQRSPALKWEC